MSRLIVGDIKVLPSGGPIHGGGAVVSFAPAPRPQPNRPTSWLVTQGFRPKRTVPPVILQGVGR
jgi:hypothetical protein